MTEPRWGESRADTHQQTKVGQASRKVWPGDVNLPDKPSLKLAQHGPDVILDQRGVGADGAIVRGKAAIECLLRAGEAVERPTLTEKLDRVS